MSFVEPYTTKFAHLRRGSLELSVVCYSAYSIGAYVVYMFYCSVFNTETGGMSENEFL